MGCQLVLLEYNRGPNVHTLVLGSWVCSCHDVVSLRMVFGGA